MTQVLITKDKLDDLADAVSEKSGATTPLTVDEMTSAIQSIVTGGGTTYSAGTGVNITNGTISIDDTVVALQTDLPTAVSDLTNDANYITGMTILSYGSSTWNDFITAYQADKVVYCRASSNANPASGSQTRLAFMAYVNNANNPTNVEFQYYRSDKDKNGTNNQTDEVFVYTLSSNGNWTVASRPASISIAVGTNMTSSYSNGTITLNASSQAPTITNTLASGELIATINGTNIYAPSYDDGDDLLYGG